MTHARPGKPHGRGGKRAAGARPDFSWERRVAAPVAGIDEAGRGPLAGPVVAAAVVFERRRLPRVLRTIDDSKFVRPERRGVLFADLMRFAGDGGARIGIGRCEVEEIDRLNILEASLTAMARAVAELGAPLEYALVDGRELPRLACPSQAIIGGDRQSLSIAAASIVAKVTRDRIMTALDVAVPGYGWADNAGYATRAHLAALKLLGPSPHHRKSFAPIRALLAGTTPDLPNTPETSETSKDG